MKSIFDETTLQELITRIKKVSAESKRKWGKMNVYEMLKHCTQWEEMMLGKKNFKRSFLGRIFGKIALKDLMKSDKGMKQNLPTLPAFIVKGTGDVELEKEKWIKLIEEHAHSPNLEVIHPFFGKLTQEQNGNISYKHVDHHLRQFDC